MIKQRIIYNGSYFSRKPNGISVVSRELAKSINPNLMTLLAPFSDNQSNFHKIPENLSPDNGLYSHARRLFWNQFHLGNYLKKEYSIHSILQESQETAKKKPRVEEVKD